MQKRTFLFPALLFALLISALNISGCCFWGDDTSGLDFDSFVTEFAEAFIDNDTSTASALKSAYPSYYSRMLNNLQSNMNNMNKTQDERNTAALFYAWASLID